MLMEPSLPRASVTFRKGIFFVLGVTFDGFDQVGNEVVTTLERGLDVAPRLFDGLVAGVQAAVGGDPRSDQKDDDDDDNAKNGEKRFHVDSGLADGCLV